MSQHEIWWEDDGLTSKGLAIVIVDALIEAGLVPRDRFDRAIDITERKIEARKTLRDY